MVKRTCRGCKALWIRVNNNGCPVKPSCSLGYKCELIHIPHGRFLFTYGAKPLEGCPKPKTWKDFENINRNMACETEEENWSDDDIWN